MRTAFIITATLISWITPVIGTFPTYYLKSSRLALVEFEQAAVAPGKGSATITTPGPCDVSERKTSGKAQSGHGITLSWDASAPATQSPKDAVAGYVVYRSTKPHDSAAKVITTRPVAGTSCMDARVEAGKTYYYTIRAINASGALGKPSQEIRVQLPKKSAAPAKSN
jgi:hypothetical protein